jgi:uncharacterized protein YggE
MTIQPRLQLLIALAAAPTAACHDRPQVIMTADSSQHPGQMTVTGTAKLEVSPDCADLTMTILTADQRPGTATRDAQAKEQAIVERLRQLGIVSKDLTLSSLTLTPQYAPDSPAPWSVPKLRGYQVSITITATTRDFTKLSAMMEAGAEAGASTMESQFRRSDLDKLKRDVRDMALRAAKDKADQTAHALGIHLGRITSVAESATGVMWRNEYLPPANVAQATGVAASRSDGAELGGTMQPLTLDVTVGYEIANEI